MRRSSIALLPFSVLMACSSSSEPLVDAGVPDLNDGGGMASAGDAGPTDANPAFDLDGSVTTDTASPDAVSAAPPKRVVFFVSTLGIHHKKFRMTFQGTDTDAGFERSLGTEAASLSEILRPFESLLPNLVVVDGLTQHASLNPWVRYVPNSDVIDEAARLSVLTGVAPLPKSTAVHPTVAQLISDAIAPGHPVGALVLAQSRSSSPASPWFGSPWIARPALQKMEGLSKSARDCIVASPDLPKQDATLASLQLIATSLRCGATSVAAFDMPEGYAGSQGDLHQDCADGINHGDSCFTAFNVSTAKMVADFAQSLKAIPEGGGTMLDNTLVVWISTEGAPGHLAYPWNAVLVGGQAVGLKGGRYLRVPQNVPTEDGRDQTGSVSRGPSHNHLLISIARLMGLQINQLGTAVFEQNRLGTIDATGPLPGL